MKIIKVKLVKHSDTYFVVTIKAKTDQGFFIGLAVRPSAKQAYQFAAKDVRFQQHYKQRHGVRVY